jgi:predicted  nucleic acid-binding Zn-ribbon protein
MSNLTTEISLIQALNKVHGEIEKMNDHLLKIEISQAEIKTKVDNAEKGISELRGSQFNQIWVLIGIVFFAIAMLSKLALFPSHL